MKCMEMSSALEDTECAESACCMGDGNVHLEKMEHSVLP